MKNKISILLFTVFVLMPLLSAFYTPQTSWLTYRFRTASFLLKFPERPQTLIEKQLLIAKAQEKNTVYQVAVNYDRQFELKNAASLLKESIDGFINPSTDKIISQKNNFKIQNYPALEARIQTSDGLFIIFRAVITEDRLFQFIISDTVAFPAESQAAEFLDSFKIL